MRRAFGYLGRGLLWTVVVLCLVIVVAPKFFDEVYYIGPVTGHYDGQRFANPDGDDDVAGGTGTGPRGNFLVRYLLGNDGRPKWPDRVEVVPAKPEARVEGSRMVATWVGHATFLVQTNGLNILTDPIWSETSGPLGIGPRRVAVPGIRFEDLPKIDLVLVSHDHYDHMDLATLKRLWDRDKPVIVTSLGNDKLLRDAGIDQRFATTDCNVCPGVEGLDWGHETVLIKDDKHYAGVTVTRNHHWGSRWFADRNRALWSSFVVRLPGGNLFFAGDTGMGDGQWPREAAAYGPIRLALIPIGAFRFSPGQMAAGSHIGPIYAAEVFDRLAVSRGIGMHWGTFRLSYEGYDTPPKMLAAVMHCRGQSGFDTVAIGKPTEIAPYAKPVAAVRDFNRCLASPAVTALP